MTTLVNLIGEQTVPNIIPLLFLKPEKTILLHTEKTVSIAHRLRKIFPGCTMEEIDPYDFTSNMDKLDTLLNKTQGKIVYNITGGTKIMSIALFQHAVGSNSEAIYIQSEKDPVTMTSLSFDEDYRPTVKSIKMPVILDIDTYLRCHLSDYYVTDTSKETDDGFIYENAIVDLIMNSDFELMQNIKPRGEGDQLEIDAVIKRKGTNNFGIVEIKLGNMDEGPKKGIEQLALAGSREYLGTYIKKFLITERTLSKRIKSLADKHNIILIDGIKRDRFRKNSIESISKKILIDKLHSKL